MAHIVRWDALNGALGQVSAESRYWGRMFNTEQGAALLRIPVATLLAMELPPGAVVIGLEADGREVLYRGDASSVPVVATDPASLMFTQSGLGAVARSVEQELRERVSVTQFAGVDPTGVADSTAGIQAAIDTLTATGGLVNLPRGTFRLGSRITVPGEVGLRGASHMHGGVAATQFELVAAGAGITFSGSGGPTSGDFNLDGNNVATNPFLLTTGAHRSFANLHVHNALEDNVIIREHQNAVFLHLMAQFSGRDNLVLDDSTGGHRFYALLCEQAGRYAVYVTQTNAPAPGAYTVPTHIRFDHALLESNAINSLVHIAKGSALTFVSCRLSSTGVPTWPMIEIAAAAGGYDSFIGCDFVGGSLQSVILVGSGSGVQFDGLCTATGPASVIGNGLGVVEDFALWRLAGGTAYIDPAIANDGDTVNFNSRRCGQILSRRAAARYVLQGQVTGEAGARFRLRADGRLDIGDGTSFTFDTNVYRSAANTLKTDDKFLAALGLGVGNSAAAATPGTVIRKMEVFDASGVSLGFVPIYDAIT